MIEKPGSLAGKLLLISIFLVFYQVNGQISLDGEIDIPIGLHERLFNVVTAGENGVILYRETTDIESETERTWEIRHLSTDLEVLWSTSLKSEYNFSIILAYADQQFFYLLFKNQSSSNKEVKIFRFDLQTKNFITIPLKSFVPRKIDYFQLKNNTIILGGSEKGKPAVVFYPQLTDRPVILQGIFGKRGEILDIFHDGENSICTILYRFRNQNGNWSVSVKSYDYDGKIIEDTNIEPDGLIQISDARTRIMGNRRIVMGTYWKRGNSAIIGYFSATITPKGTYDLNLFPLNTLDQVDTVSFSDTDSTKLDPDGNNTPDKFEYMMVREIKKIRGQLFLLTETISPADMFSKAREKSGGKVRFIDGDIISFAGNGDLLWKYDFLLSGYYTELFPALTKFEQIDDTMTVFFHYKKAIAEQKLIDGTLIPGYLYADLELNDIYDEYNQESLNVNSEIRSWYGSNYLFISNIENSESINITGILSLRKLILK